MLECSKWFLTDYQFLDFLNYTQKCSLPISFINFRKKKAKWNSYQVCFVNKTATTAAKINKNEKYQEQNLLEGLSHPSICTECCHGWIGPSVRVWDRLL